MIGTDDEHPEDRKPAAEHKLEEPVSIIFVPRVTDDDLPGVLGQLYTIEGVAAMSTVGWTGGHVIHVTTKNGTKEQGIARVLGMLGVQPNETVGVGDRDNDVHLFVAAGHRIAVGNASDALKLLSTK